jgi:hypothetical protein
LNGNDDDEHGINTQSPEDGRGMWQDDLKGHEVLHLNNVTRFNAGSYECKATNEVSEATVTFKVDVNCKYK